MTATLPAAAQAARCARCERTLPATAFTPDKRSQSGLQSWCRSCVNSYQRQRRTYPPCPGCGQRRPPAERCGTCQDAALQPTGKLAAQRAARIRATVEGWQARDEALHLWLRRQGEHPDEEVRLRLAEVVSARIETAAALDRAPGRPSDVPRGTGTQSHPPRADRRPTAASRSTLEP